MKQWTGNSVVLATVAVALMAGIAPGAEEARGHGSVSHRVITIDGDRIRPSTLTMKKDDVLEFVNYSATPMMLVFIEPGDHFDKAHCHVAGLRAAPKLAPDVFRWGSTHQPTEIIPPARFMSICSLAPGRYTFVTKEVGMDAPGPMEKLGIKGTVTVE